MTGKIKLNAASGGGSFSLQAPSSSSNDRVFTLPDSADATILTSTASLGKILQVVQTVKGDTSSFSISSGGTHDDTNFAGSITPSSTSSNILVEIMVNHATSSDQIAGFNLMCNGSEIGRGAASGNRARLTGCYHAGEPASATTLAIKFLHSPSSTSQQTYNLRWRHNSSSTRTHYINRSHDDNDASGNGMGPRCLSTIILTEIAG
tara:strand:- start:139 stop:756 length:618 start_codon:yes stop_codon:yes gene_type:complete